MQYCKISTKYFRNIPLKLRCYVGKYLESRLICFKATYWQFQLNSKLKFSDSNVVQRGNHNLYLSSELLIENVSFFIQRTGVSESSQTIVSKISSLLYVFYKTCWLYISFTTDTDEYDYRNTPFIRKWKDAILHPFWVEYIKFEVEVFPNTPSFVCSLR